MTKRNSLMADVSVEFGCSQPTVPLQAMGSDLLMPSELCAALKISRRTYARLVAQGMPPTVRIFSLNRYRLSDVEKWLKRLTNPGFGLVGLQRPVRVSGSQLLDDLKYMAKTWGR